MHWEDLQWERSYRGSRAYAQSNIAQGLFGLELERRSRAAGWGVSSSLSHPGVTPTNLLYNVVATPGALYRYWRQRQTGGALAATPIPGTVPRGVGGPGIPRRFLPGPRGVRPVTPPRLIPPRARVSPSPDSARGGAQHPAAGFPSSLPVTGV